MFQSFECRLFAFSFLIPLPCLQGLDIFSKTLTDHCVCSHGVWASNVAMLVTKRCITGLALHLFRPFWFIVLAGCWFREPFLFSLSVFT